MLPNLKQEPHLLVSSTLIDSSPPASCTCAFTSPGAGPASASKPAAGFGALGPAPAPLACLSAPCAPPLRPAPASGASSGSFWRLSEALASSLRGSSSARRLCLCSLCSLLDLCSFLPLSLSLLLSLCFSALCVLAFSLFSGLSSAPMLGVHQRAELMFELLYLQAAPRLSRESELASEVGLLVLLCKKW